jgi:hypothetical protein
VLLEVERDVAQGESHLRSCSYTSVRFSRSRCPTPYAIH